jgi:hypothetical protein
MIRFVIVTKRIIATYIICHGLLLTINKNSFIHDPFWTIANVSFYDQNIDIISWLLQKFGNGISDSH